MRYKYTAGHRHGRLLYLDSAELMNCDFVDRFHGLRRSTAVYEGSHPSPTVRVMEGQADLPATLPTALYSPKEV